MELLTNFTQTPFGVFIFNSGTMGGTFLDEVEVEGLG